MDFEKRIEHVRTELERLTDRAWRFETFIKIRNGPEYAELRAKSRAPGGVRVLVCDDKGSLSTEYDAKGQLLGNKELHIAHEDWWRVHEACNAIEGRE